MNARCVGREEQLKLITECRSSGLSDYQWCEAHGIHFGTFYNWDSKFRKADIILPDSESKHLGTHVHQEAVKLDLYPNPPTSTLMKQNNNILAMSASNAIVAMEMVMDNSTIRFLNNTNQELIRTTLQGLD